jgi:signal transduction histidine kinase
LGQPVFRPHLPRRTVRLRLTLLYGCLFLLSGAGLLAVTYVLVHNALAGPLQALGGSPPRSLGGGIVHAPAGDNGLLAQQAADLHQLLVQSAIALAIMAVVSIGLGWVVAGRVLKPLRVMTATTRRISERSLHERLTVGGPDDELKDLGDTVDELLARLEAAFDSQRRFVANASHELRTPLMVTQTMLQVALADPGLTLGSLRSTCQDVIDVGKDQAQLIDALLILARSQRGLDHRGPVDLAAVVADALDSAEPTATSADLTVDTTIQPALVAGDERLIRTLVTNLVSNAIRYNRPRGNIQILATPQAGRSLLRVTNTGPPVPGDQIDRLLQPFQRLNDQQSTDRDSLGLGLSIVAAIAAAHGATLSLHPQPTGGMTVDVAFPHSLASTRGPKTTRPHASSDQHPRQCRVAMGLRCGSSTTASSWMLGIVSPPSDILPFVRFTSGATQLRERDAQAVMSRCSMAAAIRSGKASGVQANAGMPRSASAAAMSWS